MPNSNPQKFDRAELADFYEKLVLYFELNEGLKSAPLSASSKGYRKLKQELNLTIRSANTLEDMAALMQQVPTANQTATDHAAAKPAKGPSSVQNLICVYNSEGNLLKSIFTQLRNAAAHAHIRKVKKGQICYQIEHVYASRSKKGEVAKTSLRFFCCMKKTDFWRFVEAAKNLKSTIKFACHAQDAKFHLNEEVAE